jgi:hypothetical protein
MYRRPSNDTLWPLPENALGTESELVTAAAVAVAPNRSAIESPRRLIAAHGTTRLAGLER